MTPTRPSVLTILALAVTTFAIYAWHLASAPVYLAHDEIVFALNAHSIAASGRGMEGSLFPLFFHVGGNFWATPVNIYLTSLFLKILPLSATTIRLPSVVVGVTDVVLMYFVARKLFAREWLAVLAAAILALTPSHMLHSRLGVDHLYPLPFLLGALLCLLLFLESGRVSRLVAAAALLSVGAYTYLASLVMMPVYFALMLLTIWLKRERSPRTYIAAVVGFALPLLPLVLWLALHPAQYGQQVRMYNIYDSSRLGPLQGIKDLLSFFSLTVRVAVYYNFFNPVMLFLSGDASVLMSTGRAGVFLLSLAVFLPVGIYRAMSGGKAGPQDPAVRLLLLLGFVAAPIAAVMVGEVRINRALVILPFGALLAALGVESLVASRHAFVRVAAVVLVALLPWQFYGFYRDYLTDYRIRSSVWFERNLPGAFDVVAARAAASAAAPVYLSTDIPWIDAHWTFHLIEHGRQDLLARTTYFDPKTLVPDVVPAGSLIVDYANSAAVQALAARGQLRAVGQSTEPNGVPSFTVWER